MPITYGDSGTNRTPTSIFYQDGATRRTLSEVWYGDGVTKRQVYSSAPAVSANLTDHSITSSHTAPGSGTASFRLAASGQASGTASGDGPSTGTGSYAGEWLVSGAASDCEARATLTSGGPTGGDALGTWLSLGTDRFWSVVVVGNGVLEATLTVEIRNATTGAVLDSATITLESAGV